MIEHVFSDLDGTLYRGGISDEDKNQIEKLMALGITFHIATGRTYKLARGAVEGRLDNLGYMVVENGAYVYSPDGKIISENLISNEVTEKIVKRYDELAKEYNNLNIYLKHMGKNYMEKYSKIFNEHFSADYTIDPKFAYNGDFGDGIGNIGIICEEYDDLIKVRNIFRKEYSDLLDIYLSSPYTINMVRKGASKMEAIKEIASKEGWNLDTIASIGDSANDESMVGGCKYGFAMDSADSEVLDVCDYVVKSVSEACEMIEKINSGKTKNI